MEDTDLVLDLRCPPRAVIFYVATSLPLVGLVVTFFLAGWNGTAGQTILLASLGCLFALPAIQGLQERVQVSRGAIRTRYLGWWRTLELSQSVHFHPVPDRNGYAVLARRWLRAPPSIGITDIQSGRVVAQIGYDMLAGMGDEEYKAVLARFSSGVCGGVPRIGPMDRR